MRQTILSNIIKNQIIVHQIEQYIRELIPFHFNIRTNTSTVTNFTSGSCMEYSCQTIRDTCYRTVCILLCIIDSLNATATWNIIFRCSNLQCTIIRQWASSLHQTLSISTRTNNHRTIHILHRTAQNFRSRSRITIYKHSQRHFCIYWFILSFE